MNYIKLLYKEDYHDAAEVIRKSFSTVAAELGITEDNCPKYVGFVTTAERLNNHYNMGWLMYGLFHDGKLIGYSSVSKESETEYEIHNLSVLPEYRHNGYGNMLLTHCIDKIKELGGNKVKLSIVEENTILKNWYISYGFKPMGTKKFDHLSFTSGYMESDIKVLT